VNRSLITKTPLLLLLLLLAFAPAGSVAAANDDLVVWSAYNVKFDAGNRKVCFLASVYVLNLTQKEFRDLTFTARPPEGFTLEPPPPEIHKAMRRQEDFHEEMVDGAYRMSQKFLGGGQATTIFYQVRFTGRPTVTDFPGLQIQYRSGEETREFQAVSEAHDLTKYGRFSGNINDYIRRYAALNLDLLATKGEAPDWSFSALDYRASGSNPMGIIEVNGDTSEGSVRIQAGFPGDFREILLRWVPKKRGRKNLITQEYVTEALEEAIKSLGDFSIEPGSLKWSEIKLARVATQVVEGRWVDRKKARLGSGPFRLYVLNDRRSARDLFLYIGAQARGVGPENADQPAPEKEAELMKELEGIIATLRF
jgi:hypothetical protein